MSKIRLDMYLLNNGYFPSREKARIAIMEGKIFVNNIKEDKPGTMIKEDAIVELKGEKLKYVSRGGYKLEKAIEVFDINLNDKICMDIGSSTGGFTDCMLQNGAKKVFAIDCGTNQLEYKLRIDNRVVVMENTNARYLKSEDIGNEKIDFVSVDVSFISLNKILPVIKENLVKNGKAILLIKPQFEAGKELVEKNGVVRDKKVHSDVIANVISDCNKNELVVLGLDFSPIKGPAGNIEYLLYISNEICEECFKIENIERVVQTSHKSLDN